nr:hypothetical protein [Gammaproteobacteria bacterium]
MLLAKARRLEIWTLVYLLSSDTSDASQLFRRHLVSGVSALTFLICTWIAQRSPNDVFPYGYHGAISTGYLGASLTYWEWAE